VYLSPLQNLSLSAGRQKIVYAKGQSQIILKLRGTFEPLAPGAAAVETTELQKSIFNAPPSRILAKPVENEANASDNLAENPAQGVKRPREDEAEEEEESDVSMEEDEDDAPMEEDDDDE